MASNIAMPDNDPCCGPLWEKASLAGDLDRVQEWECPKCGTLWLMEENGPFRCWKPCEFIDVFQTH